MSYKPDKATLTSFVYGELSKEEHEKVTNYLDKHPDVKKEVDEIQSMRKFMGGFQDKEVGEPVFVLDDSARKVMISPKPNLNGFAKSTLAIAASITILLLAGYFTSFNLSNSVDGLQISFGESQNTSIDATPFDEESIRNWLMETLVAHNAGMMDKISNVESGLEEQSNQLQVLNTNSKVPAKIDEALLDEYISKIKAENRDILISLLEVSSLDQKRYMDELMRDFANYIEQQRQEDLKLIEAHLNSLANSTLNPMENTRNSD